MKQEIERIPAKLKVYAKDFVVEERGFYGECKTETFIEGCEIQKVDLKNLDLSNEAERKFLVCEMEKFDIDHFTAIQDLAKNLRMGMDGIGYAGTKDRKAWTSQWISIFQPDLEVLKNFRHPCIHLKNFKWAKRKIKIGFVDGNHFKICLRDIDSKETRNLKGIRNLKYLPNFFGQQRFGSLRQNNVKIGKLIFKKKYKEAVEAILFDIGEKENGESQDARKRLDSERNFKEALTYFPRRCRTEMSIIEYLARKEDDYLGALMRVERKIMLMYANSVQSKIYNEILEKSIAEEIDFSKQKIILAGYKMHFTDGRLGEIERGVMEQNNISFEEFRQEDIRFLKIKGSYRKAVSEVENMQVDVEDDEIFEGRKKILLDFCLPSGVYATTLLEMFFELE